MEWIQESNVKLGMIVDTTVLYNWNFLNVLTYEMLNRQGDERVQWLGWDSFTVNTYITSSCQTLYLSCNFICQLYPNKAKKPQDVRITPEDNCKLVPVLVERWVFYFLKVTFRGGSENSPGGSTWISYFYSYLILWTNCSLSTSSDLESGSRNPLPFRFFTCFVFVFKNK